MLGGLDILVNNAGDHARGAAPGHDGRRHRPALRRQRARRHPRRARGPEGDRARGRGSSTWPPSSPTSGGRTLRLYVATKAALLGLTRSWARELAPDILVNAVAPGPTDTPLLGFDRDDRSRSARWSSPIPLGRIARAEEIAAAGRLPRRPGRDLRHRPMPRRQRRRRHGLTRASWVARALHPRALYRTAFTTRPRCITKVTCSSARTSIVGSATTATRSACLPGSTDPTSPA